MPTTTLTVQSTVAAWINTGVILPPGYGLTATGAGTYQWNPSGALRTNSGGIDHTPFAQTAADALYVGGAGLALLILPDGATPAHIPQPTVSDGTQYSAPFVFGFPLTANPVDPNPITATVTAAQVAGAAGAGVTGRVWTICNDGLNADNVGSLTLTLTPVPPPTLTLTGSGYCAGSATLGWTAIAGANYTLTRDGTVVYTGALTTFIDAGGTIGTPHTWQVTGSGGPLPSNTVTGTPNLPPPAPTGVTATPSVDPMTCSPMITVAWAASPRATGYTATRAGDAIATTVAGTSATFAAVIGRADTFSVTAFNACGTSAPSATATATPGTIDMPAPAVQVCQSCCKKRVVVTWSPMTGATAYQIKRDNVILATAAVGGNGRFAPNHPLYLDMMVDAGRTYVYSVTPLGGCFGTGTATITVEGWTGSAKPSPQWTGKGCGCN